MKYYSNKEIREFISCPQFGDIKYGKWGSQKLEIRETLLHLITLNDEMDKMLKDRLLRIDKAIEYVENNNFYKTGMTEEGICYVVSCDKKELLDILKGSDKDEKD